MKNVTICWLLVLLAALLWALPLGAAQKYSVRHGYVVDAKGNPVGKVSGTMIKDPSGRTIGRVSGGRIISLKPSPSVGKFTTKSKGMFSTKSKGKPSSQVKERMIHSGSLAKGRVFTISKDRILNQRGLPIAEIQEGRYYDSGKRVLGYFTRLNDKGKFAYELRLIGFMSGNKIVDPQGIDIAMVDGEQVLPTVMGTIWSDLKALTPSHELHQTQEGEGIREAGSSTNSQRLLEQRLKVLDEESRKSDEAYQKRRKKQRKEYYDAFLKKARKATAAADAESAGGKERSKYQKQNKVFRRKVKPKPPPKEEDD